MSKTGYGRLGLFLEGQGGYSNASPLLDTGSEVILVAEDTKYHCLPVTVGSEVARLQTDCWSGSD